MTLAAMIGKRLLATVFVLLGVIFVTFILVMVVPGDPVQNFVGQRADEETIASLRQAWGLDQSLSIRFFRYIGRILSGDLGRSYFTRSPVLESLVERFPYTFLLAFLAVLIGAAIGVPAGTAASLRPNSFRDKGLMALTLAGISLPVFWAAILVLMAARSLDAIPLINQVEPLWINMALASFVLGIRPAALVSRITREQMAEALAQDYILAAWSRGVSRKRVVLNHALRNSLAPILTALALDFGSLLSGAAITETIFGIPGIGKYALTGLGRRDYPVIMGMVLFSAFVFVIANLMVDLLIPLINPRLRKQEK